MMTNKEESTSPRWKLSEIWSRAMEESARDWVHYRTFFWVFAGVAILVVTYLVGRAAPVHPSLTEQLLVFSLLGIFFGWFGFLLGFHNPEKKRHWSAADIVWVSLALWGLLKTLQPVDDYMREGEYRASASAVDTSFKAMFRQLVELERRHCFGNREAMAECGQLNDMHQEFVLRPGSAEFGKSEQALATVTHQGAIDIAALRKEWDRYKGAVETQEALVFSARKGDSYLIIQYVYMAALIFAFGVRMARAGADWRKSSPG